MIFSQSCCCCWKVKAATPYWIRLIWQSWAESFPNHNYSHLTTIHSLASHKSMVAKRIVSIVCQIFIVLLKSSNIFQFTVRGALRKIFGIIWEFIPNNGFNNFKSLVRIFRPWAEMEKRADSADISVLFFSLVVLIFWLYTRKLAKTAVLLVLC